MRMFLVAAVMLVLASCQSTDSFFGTSDPCLKGDLFHATFITIASTQPKAAAYAKIERTGYQAFRAQCVDGNITKFTLAKTLSAYIAAVDEWKKD